MNTYEVWETRTIHIRLEVKAKDANDALELFQLGEGNQVDSQSTSELGDVEKIR